MTTVSREVAEFLAIVCERRSLVSRYEPQAQGAMAAFDSLIKTKGLEYEVQSLNHELGKAKKNHNPAG